MRLARPILHALLCFALVVNGIGAAMASVHGTCGGQPAGAATPQADPHAGHRMAEDDDAHASGMHHTAVGDATGHHGSSAPAIDSRSHDDAHAGCPHGDDCGDCSAACRSICIAQSVFALLPDATLWWSPAPARYAQSPMQARPAPALPHPVRPPIG